MTSAKVALLVCICSYFHKGLCVKVSICTACLCVCALACRRRNKMQWLKQIISHTSSSQWTIFWSNLIILLCWDNDSPLNTIESKINTTSETLHPENWDHMCLNAVFSYSQCLYLFSYCKIWNSLRPMHDDCSCDYSRVSLHEVFWIFYCAL